jgi:hypothetical protein
MDVCKIGGRKEGLGARAESCCLFLLSQSHPKKEGDQSTSVNICPSFLSSEKMLKLGHMLFTPPSFDGVAVILHK